MKKKKKVTLRPMALYVVCVLLVVLVVVYIGFGIFFQKRFGFGTTVDGIKVGGKTVEEVESLITREIDRYKLTVKERGDETETIVGTDAFNDPDHSCLLKSFCMDRDSNKEAGT